MKRRGITVLVGALVAALLSIGIVTAPVPYVVLGPGPTVDTLGTEDDKQVIQVSGAETSDSAGQLRLVTVGVTAGVDIMTALGAWFDGDRAVVPRELIYPPGLTVEQVEQTNAAEFQHSQTSAETAALRELGYPVRVVVTKVTPGSPAEGVLAKDDVITSVDGAPATSALRLTELIRAKPAGTPLTIGYTRGGESATASLAAADAGDGQPPRIGVEIEQRQPHPFQLTIDLDEIGGPSAGMMFALGIIDKLEPEDLTGGRTIAGTGSLDDEGRVGPIGGIPQKLVAAKRDGATVFLTPAENCAEALRNAVPGLEMFKVSTLDEALAALETLRAGSEPPRCTEG